MTAASLELYTECIYSLGMIIVKMRTVNVTQRVEEATY